jgi:hypothetical protein
VETVATKRSAADGFALGEGLDEGRAVADGDGEATIGAVVVVAS